MEENHCAEELVKLVSMIAVPDEKPEMTSLLMGEAIQHIAWR